MGSFFTFQGVMNTGEIVQLKAFNWSNAVITINKKFGDEKHLVSLTIFGKKVKEI